MFSAYHLFEFQLKQYEKLLKVVKFETHKYLQIALPGSQIEEMLACNCEVDRKKMIHHVYTSKILPIQL